MSTNGSGSRKSKIFSLFRDVEPFELKGPDGEVVVVLFQALDWDKNNALIRRMEKSQVRIKAEMSETGDRVLIAESAERMTVPDIISTILAMERPLADESSDLAPGADTEAKEQSAVQKWEATRKKELEELDPEELRALFIRRQESLFVQARAAQEFMNDSLCYMTLDPETKAPLFSMHPEHDNYIGDLMPETRQKLLEGRAVFLQKRGEKSVRKAAESGAFLSSGESPSPPADSPGETTEIPVTSQPSP